MLVYCGHDLIAHMQSNPTNHIDCEYYSSTFLGLRVVEVGATATGHVPLRSRVLHYAR
jgi:hypothetical protein